MIRFIKGLFHEGSRPKIYIDLATETTGERETIKIQRKINETEIVITETAFIFEEGETIQGTVTVVGLDMVGVNGRGLNAEAGIWVEFCGQFSVKNQSREKMMRSTINSTKLRLVSAGDGDEGSGASGEEAGRLCIYPFRFENIKAPVDSYNGMGLSLDYFIRVTLDQALMGAIEEEILLFIRSPTSVWEVNKRDELIDSLLQPVNKLECQIFSKEASCLEKVSNGASDISTTVASDISTNGSSDISKDITANILKNGASDSENQLNVSSNLYSRQGEPVGEKLIETQMMEVGLEEFIHIRVNIYGNGHYKSNSIIKGSVEIFLIRIRVVDIRALLIKKEIVHCLGDTFTVVSETNLIDRQICDGSPHRGDQFPLHLDLLYSSPGLTKTLSGVCSMFSVRYYVAVVIRDVEGRRYFKQSEVTLH